MKQYLHKYLIVISLIFGFTFYSCSEDDKIVIDLDNWENIDYGDSRDDENEGEIPDLEDSKFPILIAEQSQHRVIIVDRDSKGIMWEWKASESEIPTNHQSWFELPDEAKPIYNNKYVLIVGTRGGVAIVRIADKKVMFYANAKGSPHSAEILPDGNLVVACSTTSGNTEGDQLKVFKVDTEKMNPSEPNASYPLLFGHNAVWDKENKCLWATADKEILQFEYNFDGNNPQLTRKTQSFQLPDNSAHDMFPEYGTNNLIITTGKGIYTFNTKTHAITQAKYTKANIKSISTGPIGFPTILIEPLVEWHTHKVLDSSGNTVFSQDGFQMYKARWFIPNTFSYPDNDDFKQPSGK